jgi:phenylacetate-CoA ligase
VSAIEPLTDRDPFDRARAIFLDRLPAHFERLRWPADRLRAHQTEALRALLRLACRRSPYHARRLGPVAGDLEAFTLEDLGRLPVMTKDDMMDRYDEVTTDRRLTRDAVESFIAGVGEAPTALFGSYVVLASGGSSGRRGVFALPLDALPDFLASVVRGGLAQLGGGRVPVGVRLAMVGAASAIHATGLAPALADGVIGTVHQAPATLPMAEITGRLRAADPTVLAGYASVLSRVADAQLAGRLELRPAMVLSTSEELSAATADKLRRAFGCPPVNSFGSSEGLNGAAPPASSVFTFASDQAVVEFVDEGDDPVAPGEPAHHVLVTNLTNTAQPLIRYRLDDRMTEQPAAPGVGHVRATLQGRSDEVIRFERPDREIHPLVVRSVLVRDATVSEYQVIVGPQALRVALVPTGPVDRARLTGELTAALATAGVEGIGVEVDTVDRLPRDPRTGKLRPIVTEPAVR